MIIITTIAYDHLPEPAGYLTGGPEEWWDEGVTSHRTGQQELCVFRLVTNLLVPNTLLFTGDMMMDKNQTDDGDKGINQEAQRPTSNA